MKTRHGRGGGVPVWSVDFLELQIVIAWCTEVATRSQDGAGLLMPDKEGGNPEFGLRALL